jgi:hypothetical protein
VSASHPRSSSRSIAAFVVSVVVLAMVAAVGATPAQARPIGAARAHYALAIEPLAGYQPQITCSPYAKPGVVSLSERLLRAFPTTRSLGIVRACNIGGTSEHKEGRAFDWGVNAHSVKDRARVARFMKWLMKTDAYGNRYAMARRLGIQYLIWNHKIWGSYAASAGWRKYSGPNPHTDHVHISFTWAGAGMKTSFWTGVVGDVTAAPTPPPPPAPKPPSDGTRPEPVPAPTLAQGPPLADETVTLAGTAAGVTTVGALTKGQHYLIEAAGTWKWGTRVNQVADAECSTAPHDRTWLHDRSVVSTQPLSDHLGLYVDGTDMAADPDTDTGGGCDTATHTYRWTYTPPRTGRVKFASWDPTTLTDNSGALTIRVIKSAPVDQMTWSVPASAGAGVTSPGALAKGQTYIVTVTGTFAAGGGVLADGECSTTPADPVWRRTRDTDPALPGAERLHVLVDKQAAAFTAVTDLNTTTCDTNHVYRAVLTPSKTRPINLRVDDLTPLDNTGALTVTATRFVQPTGAEAVAVDSKTATGAQTGRLYQAGRALRITAVGSYTFAAGKKADAECTSTTATPVWHNPRNGGVDRSGNSLRDVTVAGLSRDWKAPRSATCDGTHHTYTLTYTPSITGPLAFGVADTSFRDNAGKVSVTVVPIG